MPKTSVAIELLANTATIANLKLKITSRCTLCYMQAVGGIIPALQKLSYAGKNFEDSQRSLQQ